MISNFFGTPCITCDMMEINSSCEVSHFVLCFFFMLILLLLIHRVIYKYIACINSIDQYCQKQAVNLLSEMVERMVKPTKNILQCDPKTVLGE